MPLTFRQLFDFTNRTLILVVIAGVLVGCAPEVTPPTLPALQGQIEQTSVSGLSSGAYMAGQFQLAHSKIVMGAGIIAGGPYGCADSVYTADLLGPGAAFINLTKAINGCMLNAMKLWGVPNPALLAKRAEERAAAGEIDPLEHVRDDRIYLYSGQKDRTVVPAIVKATERFYRVSGVAISQLQFVTDQPAGHAMVTSEFGIACGRTAEPYITDCDYDQAGALLGHIYGPLKPRSTAPQNSFLAFDQSEFTHGLKDHGMAATGLAYIPSQCAGRAACKVHIVFHGCSQNRDKLGDTFASQSGYAEWADTNDLVLLFPQTKVSPLNPKGCWDWWGYTGKAYLTKSAPQIIAVRRMLERLNGQTPVT